MTSADGSVVIAANGEIYNFREIRRALRHYEFRSESDSEVLLHGYCEWGLAGLLRRIEGIYAFYVYDVVQRQVHLVRDRVGVKPLYYGRVGDEFVWASELKAVKTFCQGRHVLTQDPTSLFDCLTYRYIPAPKSLYKEIFKVEPGEAISLDLALGEGKTRKYWSLPVSEAKIDSVEAQQEVRMLLAESIHSQMVSDVGVGFFLSGGIDSSTVVAMAAQSGYRPHTFAIGYDVRSHDETGYAAELATMWNTHHSRKQVSVDESVDLVARMAAWYDEPFADTSALPTWEVAKLARGHSKVALTGDGGDELFGGYRWYERYPRFRRRQQPFSCILGRCLPARPLGGARQQLPGFAGRVTRRIGLMACLDPWELYIRMLDGTRQGVRERYRSALGVPSDYDDWWHIRRFYRPDLSPRKRLQYIDFHTYLPDDILTKVDRVTMSVGLEARVPFLSTKLAEYAFSLPECFTYCNGELKGGLKSAVSELLSKSITTREKQGFSIPMRQWAETTMPGAESFQELLVDRYMSNE